MQFWLASVGPCLRFLLFQGGRSCVYFLRLCYRFREGRTYHFALVWNPHISVPSSKPWTCCHNWMRIVGRQTWWTWTVPHCPWLLGFLTLDFPFFGLPFARFVLKLSRTCLGIFAYFCLIEVFTGIEDTTGVLFLRILCFWCTFLGSYTCSLREMFLKPKEPWKPELWCSSNSILLILIGLKLCLEFFLLILMAKFDSS